MTATCMACINGHMAREIGRKKTKLFTVRLVGIIKSDEKIDTILLQLCRTVFELGILGLLFITLW